MKFSGEQVQAIQQRLLDCGFLHEAPSTEWTAHAQQGWTQYAYAQGVQYPIATHVPHSIEACPQDMQDYLNSVGLGDVEEVAEQVDLIVEDPISPALTVVDTDQADSLDTEVTGDDETDSDSEADLEGLEDEEVQADLEVEAEEE